MDPAADAATFSLPPFSRDAVVESLEVDTKDCPGCGIVKASVVVAKQATIEERRIRRRVVIVMIVIVVLWGRCYSIVDDNAPSENKKAKRRTKLLMSSMRLHAFSTAGRVSSIVLRVHQVDYPTILLRLSEFESSGGGGEGLIVDTKTAT